MNSIDHDPIYINVCTITGINSNASQNLQNQPATIIFKNEDSIAKNPEQYYLSLNRALINTSLCPIYIFPIKNGIAQTDINLSPFSITFEYYTNANTLLYSYTRAIYFQSQLLDQVPLPPSQNNGLQDFTNAPLYYFVYDVAWMLKIFNDNIYYIYQYFVNQLQTVHGVTIPVASRPFYTFDYSTRLFSLNFDKTYFNQSVYPQVLMYQDSTSGDLFGCPNNFYANENLTNYLMVCYDLLNNTIKYPNISNNDYLIMTGENSPLNLWCPIKRILFTISDIPIKKLEIESSFNNIPFEAQQNNDLNSISRPNLNIFFDLAVDQDAYAINKNVVQYAVSSIAESRLVALGSGQDIRNFVINIYWVDTAGNYRPLKAVANTQNLIKLALYKKSTMLL
jgi:hypothetical protein